MYAVYSVFIVLFFIVMSPYLVYQAVRYRKYVTSLPQRLGILPVSFNLDADESIWIHAVSVGEVLTARALLQELRERYPRLRIFLSTTTITGHQVARNNLQFVDDVFYFPFDFRFIVERTLRGPIAADNPASLLRRHPNCALFVDADAAATLFPS